LRFAVSQAVRLLSTTGGAQGLRQPEETEYFRCRKLEDFRVQDAVHSLGRHLKTHHAYAPEQEENDQPVARMVVHEALMNR
jgi:hypothetical protein